MQLTTICFVVIYVLFSSRLPACLSESQNVIMKNENIFLCTVIVIVGPVTTTVLYLQKKTTVFCLLRTITTFCLLITIIITACVLFVYSNNNCFLFAYIQMLVLLMPLLFQCTAREDPSLNGINHHLARALII